MTTHTTAQAEQLLLCPVGTGEAFRPCMGMRCAMWRYYLPIRRNFVKAANPDALAAYEAGESPMPGYEFSAAGADDDGIAGWVEPFASAQARTRGFCGMGGRP